MPWKFHVYHYFDDRITGAAKRIEEKLDLIIVQRRNDHIRFDELATAINKFLKEGKIMFEDTQAKVQRLTDAADAMEIVLADISAKLSAALTSSTLTADDRARLEAIHAALDAEADDIIAKTLANTPADPAAPPVV